VVLVPALEAATQRTRGAMLSWLERGLAEEDETGALTEFLVAPIPARGRGWLHAPVGGAGPPRPRTPGGAPPCFTWSQPAPARSCTSSRSSAAGWIKTARGQLASPARACLNRLAALEAEVREQFAAWAAAADRESASGASG